MTFKPRVWYPLATLLAIVNVVSVPFAVMPGEPWHATAHAVLAVAFGLWAQRLRQRLTIEREEALETPDQAEQIDGLEDEVLRLRQELSEMQERLDFTERVLVQKSGVRPPSP